jgi:hypothetical protein
MLKAIKAALKRLGRAAAATLISAAVVHTTNDPKWILLAPVIQSAAKFLRERFTLKNVPL